MDYHRRQLAPQRLKKLWAVVAIAATACGGLPEARLQEGFSSIDALTAAFVEAVTEGDTAAMHSMRVTEREHNDLMWPQFPASRPEVNMPVSYAWYNLNSRSLRNASRVANEYRGREINVRGTRCRRGTTDYETFRIHSDCVVVTADSPGGLKLFGSIVEMNGAFKIVGIVEH